MYSQYSYLMPGIYTFFATHSDKKTARAFHFTPRYLFINPAYLSAIPVVRGIAQQH